MKAAGVAALTVSILLLVGVGCGGGNSPQAVAKGFAVHVWRADLEGAKPYATKETCDQLDTMIEWGRKGVEDNFKVRGFHYTFEEETVESNRATVVYRFNKGGIIRSVNLIKVDGAWKVHAPDGTF